MARAIAVAAGTGDVQGVTGASTLVGVCARETVGAAAGGIVLRNGTTTSDPIVAVLRFAANGSGTFDIPAVDCPDGIFVDRDGTGTTELVLYVL